MDLPPIAAAYFTAAGSPDDEAYADLFAEDAVVEDEGKEYHGIDEIRAWRAATPPASYQVVALRHGSLGAIVTAAVSGGLPGTHATLHYHFNDHDGRHIRELRIHP